MQNSYQKRLLNPQNTSLYTNNAHFNITTDTSIKRCDPISHPSVRSCLTLHLP